MKIFFRKFNLLVIRPKSIFKVIEKFFKNLTKVCKTSPKRLKQEKKKRKKKTADKKKNEQTSGKSVL